MRLTALLFAVACGSNAEPLPTGETGDAGPSFDAACPGPGYRLCYLPPTPDPGETALLRGRLDLDVVGHTDSTAGADDDPARFLTGERAWLGGRPSARGNEARISYVAVRDVLDGFDEIDLDIFGLTLIDNGRVLTPGYYTCTARMESRKQVAEAAWAITQLEMQAGDSCRVIVDEELIVRGPDFDPKNPGQLVGSIELSLSDETLNDYTVTFQGTFVDPHE